MRRLLYLSLAGLVSLALSASIASAQTPPSVSCDQFWSVGEPWASGEYSALHPSQEDAQKYFDTQATLQERAILDLDGDGFACDAWGTGKDKLGILGGENGYWGSDGNWYYY